MLEMKITIAAPDLAAAINNLAVALANGNTVPAEKPAKAEKQTEAKDAAQQAQAPVNPMQATGAPLSATPAQTVAPVANVPVAPAVVQQAAPAVAPVAQAPVASAVPTGAPTYTLEMIARAGTALVDAGKMDALCGLLAKYGVEALTALDPAQYGNFANDLRALGAQI